MVDHRGGRGCLRGDCGEHPADVESIDAEGILRVEAVDGCFVVEDWVGIDTSVQKSLWWLLDGSDTDFDVADLLGGGSRRSARRV